MAVLQLPVAEQGAKNIRAALHTATARWTSGFQGSTKLGQA